MTVNLVGKIKLMTNHDNARSLFVMTYITLHSQYIPRLCIQRNQMLLNHGYYSHNHFKIKLETRKYIQILYNICIIFMKCYTSLNIKVISQYQFVCTLLSSVHSPTRKLMGL